MKKRKVYRPGYIPPNVPFGFKRMAWPHVKKFLPQWQKRQTTRAKATRALRLIKQFQRDEEVKEITASTACTTALDDTWSDIPLLFGIAQAAGSSTALTRIGNKVTVKSIAIKLRLALDAQETTNSCTRVVIFIDRRPNRTQVTEAEVFSTTTIMGFYETQALKNKGRFQFIFDKIFYWPGETATQNVRPLQQVIKFYYNKPFQQLYTGAAALIANLDRHAVYLCACSSNASHTGTVTAQYKVKFTDA